MFPSPWSPEGGSADATIRARIALDGFYLITDYEQWRDGRVVFRGHGVYGWDPRRARYTMSWVDSTGMGDGSAIGGTWDGDTLIFVGPAGEHHTSRYVYRFGDDEDTYRFAIEASTDGGVSWKPFLESTYRRTDE